MLTAVVERFKNAGSDMTMMGKDIEANLKKKGVTQMRVIVLLKTWIEKYPMRKAIVTRKYMWKILWNQVWMK